MAENYTQPAAQAATDYGQAPVQDAGQAEQRRELTIKFGRGLVGDPFTSKAGMELAEIKIPNVDPHDARPWESFVVPVKFIHDNQFGKGVWIKLPVDGLTKLSRSVMTGQDDKGRNIWTRQERIVANTELKELVEAYKTRNREYGGSVRSDLASKKSQADATPFKPLNAAQEEELPFR